MRTCITSSRAHLLGAALAAALAVPCMAAGQDSDSMTPAPSQPAPPAAAQETPAAPPDPAAAEPPPPFVPPAGGTEGGRQTAGAPSGGEARARPSGGARTSTGRGATATPSATPSPSTDPPSTAARDADAAAPLMVSADTGAGGLGAADSVSRARGDGDSWLTGAATAALVLLLAAQAAVVVLLGRVGREMRTFGTRLSIRDRAMNTHPEPAVPGSSDGAAADARPLVSIVHGDADSAPLHALSGGPAGNADAGRHASGEGGDGGEAEDDGRTREAAASGDGANHRDGEVEEDARDEPAAHTTGDGSRSNEGAARAGTSGQQGASGQASDSVPGGGGGQAGDSGPADGLVEVSVPAGGAAWPGGSHALYQRARARLAELQGERGEKDRTRLAAAAARFERRKAWVLALHEAWENEVDFAYLDLLQKPGVGAVKDPYVMVYPLSEHDWKATHEELRRLARHIDALPDEGHPQWPALLPRTALRSSVDFDLRVQPPRGTPPAAEFHARRLLSTLLVNLKTLQRARVELGQLVQWVVEAAPAAEARPADVSPHVIAVLDAVCAAGRTDGEREAQVDAAVAALEAADDGNFAAVRAAEDGAEKLEQRYRAFLKMLFRVVDGTDRARALHAEAMANGAAGDPWLAGWGTILGELDDLLVRRLLGGRLEIEPIACEPGQALDTDVHNPLGAERVQGVERDQVWRVESRGFAYAEDGARRVVRAVDVIVAVPA